VRDGSTTSAVVRQLGHTSFAVTKRHYVAPGALESVGAAQLGNALGNLLPATFPTNRDPDNAAIKNA
jgi:hypothetical protein